jgi:hypothetical protein
VDYDDITSNVTFEIRSDRKSRRRLHLGSAYFGSKPFKINIQEALENKLILPSELQIESNLGYVLFETEKKRSKGAM